MFRWNKLRAALVVATSSAVLSLTGVGTAHAASTWLSFAPIGPDPQQVCHDFAIAGGGSYVCDSRAAMAADGTSYLAFVNFDGSAPAPGFRRVFLSSRAPGGGFSSPNPLSPAGKHIMGNNGTLISLASNARGDIVLAWAYVEGTRGIVQVAYKPAGSSSPRVETLSNPAANANLPSVAIADDGSAVVIWRNTIAATTTVQASFLNAGATNFGPFSDISDAGTLDAVQVVMAPSGDAIAGWTRNNVVEAARRPAGGSFGGRQGLSGANSSSPDFAIAPSGRATAIWQRDNTVESRERRITPNFADGTWGTNGVVTQAGETGITPAVAVDPDNNATAVWSSTIAGERKVRAATRASGGSFSNHQPISAPGAQPFAPQVSVSPTGDSVATWALNDGSSEAVQTSRAAKGGTFGGVDVLMQGTPGFGLGVYFRPQPTVAFDDQGNAIATWVGYTCQPNCGSLKTIVQYARFDSAAPSITGMNVPGAANTGAALDMSASATDRMTGTTIAWDFGDGATGSGPSVSHAYGAAGVYTVRATATDEVGNSTSATRTVQVTTPGGIVIPAAVDNDRDGYPVGLDCNDANAAIRPGVVEVKGNRIDENCDTIAEPFPTLASGVVTNWSAKGNAITLKGLQVTQQFPRGWSVKILCKGSKCPFRSKTLKKGKVRRSASNVISSLSSKQRKFRAGQTVEVWVSAPNFNTKVSRYVLRKGKIPTTQPFCVLPGQTRPQKTCT